MKRLVRYADVLTPNLTEACILLDRPYKEKFSEAELEDMARRLCSQGPDRVVFTGVGRGTFLANFCYERNRGCTVVRTRRMEPQRSGTGDVFSSIVAACVVQGIPFAKSVRTAEDFISGA